VKRRLLSSGEVEKIETNFHSVRVPPFFSWAVHEPRFKRPAYKGFESPVRERASSERIRPSSLAAVSNDCTGHFNSRSERAPETPRRGQTVRQADISNALAPRILIISGQRINLSLPERLRRSACRVGGPTKCKPIIHRACQRERSQSSAFVPGHARQERGALIRQ